MLTKSAYFVAGLAALIIPLTASAEQLSIQLHFDTSCVCPSGFQDSSSPSITGNQTQVKLCVVVNGHETIDCVIPNDPSTPG